MYLHNKYTIWYYRIIHRASLRSLPKDFYKETHHIMPKCFGGKNTKENLAELTAHEHWVCHLLLTKMLKGQEKFKMVAAAIRLAHSRHGLIKRGKAYQQLKIELGKISSELKTGTKASEETKAKISSSLKEAYASGKRAMSNTTKEKLRRTNTGIKRTDEQRAVTKAARAKQKMQPCTEETKEKLRLANIGKKMSIETRQKIREANLKRPPMSDETRVKISENSKRMWENRRNKI